MKANVANDIRARPAYTSADAARFLRLPVSTVRAWCFGQRYRVGNEQRPFRPVVDAADKQRRLLSFLNLVELLVLAAVRRKHAVSMRSVRSAVDYLRRKHPSSHPLADHQFQTNGVDLFVEKYGEIVNISRDGQLEMRDLIRAWLSLVDRDAQGIPVRLHLPGADLRRGAPVTSGIVIDPRFGFGRPVVLDKGIRTDVVVERFHAGESIAALSEDYGIDVKLIEASVRVHQALAA